LPVLAIGNYVFESLQHLVTKIYTGADIVDSLFQVGWGIFK
jgi:hypothetical protein